jgi:chemotaxis protein methyltransferase CheR
MDEYINQIISLFASSLDIDVSAYQELFLRKITEKRMMQIKQPDIKTYFTYLSENLSELNELKTYLYISYSRFFRNSLTFEYIDHIILPKIIQNKLKNNQSIRIWSAGCASGEEPYSMAILLNEHFKTSFRTFVNLFASDIEKKSLDKAGEGKYREESIKNVKYSLVALYFEQVDNHYYLSPIIKNMVTFISYDLLDTRSFVPPECVYGNFDIVLCRNVLIYLNEQNQVKLLTKLYKALDKDGYLILGGSEYIPEILSGMFEKVNDFSSIYRKNEMIDYNVH